MHPLRNSARSLSRYYIRSQGNTVNPGYACSHSHEEGACASGAAIRARLLSITHLVWAEERKCSWVLSDADIEFAI